MEPGKEGEPLNQPPTIQAMAEAIYNFEMLADTNLRCCRNCYSVREDVLMCRTCATYRCWVCIQARRLVKQRLVPYLTLGPGFQPDTIKRLLDLFGVIVEICEGCGLQACSLCDPMGRGNLVKPLCKKCLGQPQL